MCRELLNQYQLMDDLLQASAVPVRAGPWGIMGPTGQGRALSLILSLILSMSVNRPCRDHAAF